MCHTYTRTVEEVIIEPDGGDDMTIAVVHKLV